MGVGLGVRLGVRVGGRVEVMGRVEVRGRGGFDLGVNSSKSIVLIIADDCW